MPLARQSPAATVMDDRISTPSNDASAPSGMSPMPIAINSNSSTPAAMSNTPARNPSRDMCYSPRYQASRNRAAGLRRASHQDVPESATAPAVQLLRRRDVV